MLVGSLLSCHLETELTRELSSHTQHRKPRDRQTDSRCWLRGLHLDHAESEAKSTFELRGVVAQICLDSIFYPSPSPTHIPGSTQLCSVNTGGLRKCSGNQRTV